jgi:hypothetical protein
VQSLERWEKHLSLLAFHTLESYAAAVTLLLGEVSEGGDVCLCGEQALKRGGEGCCSSLQCLATVLAELVVGIQYKSCRAVFGGEGGPLLIS